MRYRSLRSVLGSSMGPTLPMDGPLGNNGSLGVNYDRTRGFITGRRSLPWADRCLTTRGQRATTRSTTSSHLKLYPTKKEVRRIVLDPDPSCAAHACQDESGSYDKLSDGND